MAINQFIINLVKSLKAKKTNTNLNYAKSKNYLFYLISAITLFIIFLVTNNLMVERNKAENQNFSSVIKSKEFQILGDYFNHSFGTCFSAHIIPCLSQKSA